MRYTLIGSVRSPYVRLSRLFLLNNQIDFHFQVINYLESKEDAAYLARISPINKIPLLLDNGQSVFDSRVIFNLLTRRHGLRELTLMEENFLTAITTCMETSVNLLMLKMGGLDLSEPNWFIDRERERIPLCFQFLLPWVRELSAGRAEDWNYLSMALFSYLDWATFRGLIDLAEFPDLTRFLDQFQNAPGVASTDFRSK